MKSDVEIALSSKLAPMNEVAEKIHLTPDDINHYGKKMAKISQEAVNQAKENKKGHLILVTAINPTPAGEGKTTTNIGLSMALNKLGYSSISTLRQPSLGPVFGVKGGAAGGGYSQVLPMEDINLHFTGDFHAITSANNLICAMLDNHIHQGNELKINPKTITLKRVLDMNDRVLRQITVAHGPSKNGVMREDGFDITVASEIMAILCLSRNLSDFNDRVSRMIVARTYDNEPVYVSDLKAEGAVTLLMKDAILPNLVQTTEQTPAIIHGGPFANIAHGCNSIIATQTSLGLCDYTVTEAGFGADLGAEKFLDIACPVGDLKPSAVVIVATIRALKYNGGQQVSDLSAEDIESLKKGYKNLERHVGNIQGYGLPVVVAINRFPTDTEKEIETLRELCKALGVDVVLSEVWAKGSEGGLDLAKAVVDLCEKENTYKPLYDYSDSITEKIEKVAKNIYHASDVEYSKEALDEIQNIETLGAGNLPVCIAKTQMSFSDDPTKLGAPENFSIYVREIKLSNGAGFVVVKTGDIMTMPGLPKVPAAEKMEIKEDGTITGLF
ncbi:formate--tetrahydrofolate ligase [Peptoniphilus sp. KCTC 25270]|uniref:formate--tetrahydrofolate ligase n=1 Tax=Peptoniphilus sp. KCTC 25270 TaxID=2897414 RepID=UPI001E359C24|nr:formate--tetrahydrofolate ligase [Peptoniphilus sp. KCTC 25270]MCD1147126.1 formate--tetrahydrofolate ligase [Peptoniphilus sp. KCTC 25270]